MKTSIFLTLGLVALAQAIPTWPDKEDDGHVDFASKNKGDGHYESDYEKGDDKHYDYDPKKGDDKHYDYDPKKGDDKHYDYDPKKGDDKHDDYDNKKGDDKHFEFTSAYTVLATPNQVVNNSNAFTGGLKGTSGTFSYWINSHHNVICYEIILKGFRGEYQSPALTATHIHEGARGKSGPPRIVFPNPVGSSDVRVSKGCVTGPFKTGVLNLGIDTGTDFHVSEIEKNPAGFFTDVHSSLAVPGAVRGQLA